MDTPMFDQPENEVTTLFTSDGILQIIIGQKLGHTQKMQWKLGANRINGIRWSGLSDDTQYASDQTVFEIAIQEEYSTRTQEVQQAVSAYTRQFMARLTPEPKQTSLF